MELKIKINVFNIITLIAEPPCIWDILKVFNRLLALWISHKYLAGPIGQLKKSLKLYVLHNRLFPVTKTHVTSLKQVTVD